ncbi:hypothetical protein OEA41_006984 [Lepraria neglecta]|uniref:Uncharacterized protein n=1 Tax=Lepraria neglecta TaxID=209136 RepID=A0AAE0DKR4_9LECA|nr:hypothetical protein OEA41_006984 [Lepraria neglecta]
MGAMATQAPQRQPRCMEIILVWEECGHHQKLNFMPGDCEYPDFLDHTHRRQANIPLPDHKKELVAVDDAWTPCPVCKGIATPQLHERIIELDTKLTQHVTEEGFQEWQARHPGASTHPWQFTEPASTREDLQQRVLNLESLLSCGFGLSTSDEDTPRAPGSSAGSTTPIQPAPNQTPYYSILRGQTGIRREFFPGVNWETNRLSRKETAKRRDWLRRIYPQGLPIKKDG